jgi:ribosomal peptide maturation radical SAM protein 1
VALVYPPFGPAGLPSLGLSLLAGAIRRQNTECRTFYWNLQFLAKLRGEDTGKKMAAYWWLTGRAWYPFSEWTFARIVHDDALVHREPQLLRELNERSLMLGTAGLEPRDFIWMRSSAEELIAEIVEELDRYDVVGIGTTFYQNLPALALARRLKERRPERPVVLGGANCDGDMGPALFRHFPFIDYLFVGESDHGFPELVRRLRSGEPVHNVPGILTRNGHGIAAGPPASPIQKLDELPLPDFDDFIEQRQRFGLADHQSLTLALESSRGCWWGARHHCVFCGLNANGMAYRRKSDDRFQSEVEDVVRRYRPTHIFMTDNILPIEYYDGFLNWAKSAQLGTRFFYEIKANAKRAQVARMADAALTAVQPGIESFSSALLTLMRKGVSGSQNVAFLKYAREYGVRASYNLLVGFPAAGAEEYVRMLAQLPRLFHLRPPTSVVPIEYHRFSPYHQRPEDFGLQLCPADEYQHLYPYDMEDLSRIAYMFRPTAAAFADPVLQKLDVCVREWQAEYRAGECTLTWQQGIGEVLVDDLRPGFGPQRYSLQGYAPAVFRLLDEPRTISALTRSVAETPTNESEHVLSWLFAPGHAPDVKIIRFERADVIADAVVCIRAMLDAGLLFEDLVSPEPRYVALPVHASYRAEDTSWDSAGV